MSASYVGRKHPRRYIRANMASDYGGEPCQQLAGECLDEFASGRVLEALEPAALELSLEAAKNLGREREDLGRPWQQRLERAEYEAQRAGRQYRLIDPENGLVARELEREWEEKLAAHQKSTEEYHGFSRTQPRVLSEEEQEAIRELAEDMPALWEAPTTTSAERKEIIRRVVDRVVVDREGESERVGATIEWAGGTHAQGELIRPVARLEQPSYHRRLRERVSALAGEGLPAREIAERLNAEGCRPPKRRENFGGRGVRDLMDRLGLTRRRSRSGSREGLGEEEEEEEEEEWPPELARKIEMPNVTL